MRDMEGLMLPNLSLWKQFIQHHVRKPIM